MSNLALQNNIFINIIYNDIQSNYKEITSRIQYSTMRGIIYDKNIENNMNTLLEKISNINNEIEQLCDEMDRYNVLQGTLEQHKLINNKISIRINNNNIANTHNTCV